MHTRRDLFEALSAIAFGALVIDGRPLWAQNSAVQLAPLGDNIALLQSPRQGNIVVRKTNDGLLIIDSGLIESAEQTRAGAASYSPLPVRHLINTHWHYDHVGGNQIFAERGALIFAHRNTLMRLSENQRVAFLNRDFAPLPPIARPKGIFETEGKMDWGDQLHYKHLPPAHTDGDTTLHFAHANVYHCGDLFFNKLYPFIDYSTGGSIEGMIHSAETMLSAIDARTVLIPGHGPVATTKDLKVFRDLLADINEKLTAMIGQGKSLEEIQRAGITKRYDAVWGQAFLKPDQWIAMLHQGKTAGAKQKAA